MPVGVYRNEKEFSDLEFDIEHGDLVYLFSDGYYSQFDEKHKEPMKSKKFKDLLLEIHNEPMPDQKQILLETLHNWKGNSPQIDDILVVGIRIA